MKAFNLVATKNSSGTKTFISNLLLQINNADLKDTIIVFISKSYLKLVHAKYNKKVIYKVKPNYLNNFILRSIWLHFFLPFELSDFIPNHGPKIATTNIAEDVAQPCC